MAYLVIANAGNFARIWIVPIEASKQQVMRILDEQFAGLNSDKSEPQ